MNDPNLIPPDVVHYSPDGDHHGAKLLCCATELDIWGAVTDNNVHTVTERSVDPPTQFRYTFDPSRVTCIDCKNRL